MVVNQVMKISWTASLRGTNQYQLVSAQDWQPYSFLSHLLVFLSQYIGG